MATPDAELKVRIDAQLDGLQKAFRQASRDTEQFAGQTDDILSRLAKNLNIAKANFQLFGDAAQRNVSQLNAYKTALNALLEKGFRPTSKEVLTVAGNIDRLNKVINSNAGRGGLSSFGKGTNEAALALSNLGRVAQDAPFGFIGIQNNLNPLLESFQRLRQETGSNQKALKLLGSSLIGAGGLGFALSIVSSAILLYNEYQRKAQIETDKLTGKTENYADTLEDVRKAQLKGSQAAQNDLTDLKLLFSAYTDANSPLKARKDAYEQLQKLYPAYFKNIKFEKEASDKTKTAYDNLTTAIIATARARAAADLIAQNSTRKLEDEQKIIDLQKQQTNLLKEEANLRARIGSAQGNAVVGLARDLAQVEGKITENKTAQRNIATDINILDKNNLQLVKSINAETAKGGLLTGQVGGLDKDPVEKRVKDVKTVSDILKALNIDLLQVQASVDGTFGDKSKERVSAFAKAIDELISIGIKPTDGIIKGLQERLLGAQLPNVANDAAKFAAVVVSNVQKGFENAGGVLPKTLTDGTAAQTLISPFQQLNDYIGTQVFPSLQSGFDNFFTDILEKGTFSFGALGQAILKTFTSVLASEATKGILGLLNPAQTSLQKGGKGLFGLLAGALGSGGAALGTGGATATAGATAATGGLLLPILGGLAAGGLIASLFKKKQAQPAPAFNSYSNNTSPISSDTFGGGSVVFQISGTNLIGVLNRAGAKLARFNGTP